MRSKGRGKPRTFHRTRSQAFAFAKMASAPKKLRQTLWSMFFSKCQHELKTLNVLFESAFEDLSFHSFLKASDWDFEEKNGYNKHRIWLTIVSKFSALTIAFLAFWLAKKRRLWANSRSFLANQKARHAIIWAENLLNDNMKMWAWSTV